ncbi:hypothetical protein BAE44_0007633 [Dichanthelium oligosanthes]|uniref:F-box domain-containing protein n=1 Tax=Dichanthelium oligosanthes TaxID=888268 RepID=A0A1E5W1Y8_9POAL|nr:hypothetical protein BAE44_0007633 [Dichanthelium oligosanthes]
MPRGGGEGSGAAPPAAGGGGIEALPDEVLHHILGFLETHETLRTCVLARRWRHLWKSATSMRIVGDVGVFSGSGEKTMEFLERLLLLCDGCPLRKCELWFCEFGFYESAGLFEDDGMRLV